MTVVGARRSYEVPGNDNGNTNGVDFGRLQNVTFGHLWNHTSGLDVAVPWDFRTPDAPVPNVLSSLFAIRQLHDGTFTTLDDIGEDAFGLPNAPPANGRLARALKNIPSMGEIVVGSLTRCLLTTPGSTSTYNNYGFGIQGPMIQQLDGDFNRESYAGELFDHTTHATSALAAFAKKYFIRPQHAHEGEFGQIKSRYGMFRARPYDNTQTSSPDSPLDPAAPFVRQWFQTGFDPEEPTRPVGIYYPGGTDVLGQMCTLRDSLPDNTSTGDDMCRWDNTSLNGFGSWISSTYAQYTFEWAPGTAGGSLLSENHLYLRHMQKFEVGFANGLMYGQRHVERDVDNSHSGTWGGGHSRVMQFGSTIRDGHGCEEATLMANCGAGNVCLPRANPPVCDPMDPDPECCSPTGSTRQRKNCNVCARSVAYALPLGIDQETGAFLTPLDNNKKPQLIRKSCVVPDGLNLIFNVSQVADQYSAVDLDLTDDNAVYMGDYGELFDGYVFDGLCSVIGVTEG